MKTIEQRRAAIHTEMEELTLHRASGAVRQVVALLDALAEDLLGDLATIGRDGLERTQGALAQVLALRNAIVSPGPHTSPKA